jgi:flavin reductase (DIM6/NTAB) family NADH-FMN oxidoreductase RutF
MVQFPANHYRSVMGQFATGVTVVTYDCNGQTAGMTANAFMSVSIEPPLVLVSVRKASRFIAAATDGMRYGISVLGENQQQLSGHFGGKPVAGLRVEFDFHDGIPLLAGSLAFVVARACDVHAAGDHMLVIGQIEHLYLGSPQRPLVFYGGKYKQILGHDPTYWWHAGDGWG